MDDKFPQHLQHGGDAVYAAHVKKFGEIEESLGKLRERVSSMEATQGTLVEGVSNFREFQFVVRDYIAEQRTLATERKEQLEKHESAVKDALTENNNLATRRDNRIMAWIAFVTVVLLAIGCVVGVLTYLEGSRQVKAGTLKIPQISTSIARVLAYYHSQPQDAGNSAAYTESR